MLTVSRSVLRSLRSLHRKCVSGKPRGPAPPVRVSSERDASTWSMVFPEAIVACRVPGTHGNFRTFLLPLDAIAVGQATDDPISLQLHGNRAEMRWTDRGLPRTQQCDWTQPGSHHDLPVLPKSWSPMTAEFLAALHEASQTASEEPSRFALDRVQIQGETGSVIAADRSSIYWHKGFEFPFSDNVLIPALPLFGSPEWRTSTEVSLGKTESHLVVRAGVWTAFLLLDRVGRFPDVASIVPKTPTPTKFEIDGDDASSLLEALPRWPGFRDDKQPLTLDLTPQQPAVIRGQDEESKTVTELVLKRSLVTNGPSRVAINRAFLKRAIQLDCRTIRVVGADKPVVATNDRILWLTAALDPSSIVEANSTSVISRLNSSPAISLERSHAMKPAESNGHPRDRAEPPEMTDPLAEAESLRAALFEATQSATRLVALLKSKKKEQKALATVYSSLKSLNLGP